MLSVATANFMLILTTLQRRKIYMLVRPGGGDGNHGGWLYITRLDPVLINIPLVCIMVRGSEKKFIHTLGKWTHFKKITLNSSFSSVAQSCLTLWEPMDCSTPDLPVHHQLPEFTQTHVHWVGDAIQPSHPLSSPPPAFHPSQHQGLCKWVSSLHQVAKVLECQLQHQSFQWISRTDFF